MSDNRARHLISKCDHSQPVYVPCEECVHKRMARIIKDERFSAADEVKNEYDGLVKRANNDIGEVERLRRRIDTLLKDKEALTQTLDRCLTDISSLNGRLQSAEVMLQAERGAKMVYVDRSNDDEETLN